MSTTTSAKKKIFYRNRDGYMYLLPTIIVLCSVFLVPLVLSLILSFMDWNYLDLNSTPKLVGFRNYVDIFENPYDMDSFRITGIFVLASVSIEMILGIIIALLLNTKRHGVKTVSDSCAYANACVGCCCCTLLALYPSTGFWNT